MITWDDIFSPESLLIATTQVYTKCLFSRRKCYTEGHDDKTLFDWVRNNKANGVRLRNLLSKETFQYELLKKLIIKFPNKTRNIYIATWRDRIVESMLNTELNRVFDHKFSDDSYAYRLKNSGVDICQTNIAKALSSYDGPIYIAKRDIKNYYPSINKDILRDKLLECVDENDYIWQLLKNRIYFNCDFKGEILKDEPGVAFGSPLSCFFANYYLNNLDWKMKKHDVNYFRYADDILIMGASREEVLNATSEMEEEVHSLKLEFKLSHKKNLIFNGKDEEFESVKSFKHLGLLFRDTKEIGISREKVRKILNIFKRAIKKKESSIKRLKTPESKARACVNIIKKIINENIRPVAIIDYYLKHMTDERQVKDIDRMLAELVLFYATGRGYKKSNFKIIGFKKLRKMGLPSLLHRQKLLKHNHVDTSFFNLRTRKINDKFKAPNANDILKEEGIIN